MFWLIEWSDKPFCFLESLDPEIVGVPEKVEPKNPLEDEVLKKFLKQEDSVEETQDEELEPQVEAPT